MTDFITVIKFILPQLSFPFFYTFHIEAYQR